ncbi:MAG TPA: exodeoxyribonuclease VII large subunit [Gemmatimonadota bacterium]|nr:exodeoxyribonuclease VII large subunit [Gemmatimonadota bacterium]
MNRAAGLGHPAPAETPVVMSVSELVFRASSALVAEFGTVGVEGEVSSFHHHRPSGHMYWTLKDRASEVRCVMFRLDNERLAFPLEEGMHVVVVARPTIYRARGQFQLEVTQVVPRGLGALYLQFEALKRRLGEEGLFDPARKRSLPFWPVSIGVVTSAEGAALRDMVSVVLRRAPATRILLKPVAVQGREAAPEIARAVRWFARHRVAEVVIVGRGGGSLEDLWAFNEEIVVRAIADSPVPVVSAVGHETDTTLADYAADLRAPTPSAAGEHVVPETREIARGVVHQFRRLARAVERQRLRRLEEALAPIRRYGFRRVRDRAHEARQRWAEAAGDMGPVVRRRMAAERARMEEAAAGLSAPVAGRLAGAERTLGRAPELGRGLSRRHERVHVRARHLEERLRAASPYSILERGYAVVTDVRGHVVQRAGALAEDDDLAIRFARGSVAARVTRIEDEEER